MGRATVPEIKGLRGKHDHAPEFSRHISRLRRLPCPRPDLPRQADPPDRSLGPRRADRHPGAAAVADPAEARPAGGGGKPPRRGRRDRRARGRDRGARRLHAARRQHLRAGGHSGRVGERGLRPGEELCAGRQDFRELPDPRRPSVDAVAERAGADRRREGQSGQVQHRAHRPGRPAASGQRAVQGERRRRSRRRALQERRRGRHRAARRAACTAPSRRSRSCCR